MLCNNGDTSQIMLIIMKCNQGTSNAMEAVKVHARLAMQICRQVWPIGWWLAMEIERGGDLLGKGGCWLATQGCPFGPGKLPQSIYSHQTWARADITNCEWMSWVKVWCDNVWSSQVACDSMAWLHWPSHYCICFICSNHSCQLLVVFSASGAHCCIKAWYNAWAIKTQSG